MTFKKITLTAISLLFASVLLAQERKSSKWIAGAAVGYQKQEIGFLKVSGWLLTDLGNVNYLRLDAGPNFTWKNNKTYVIPELALTYYLSAKGVWPYLQAEVTPHTITPKVGVGIFNILEVGAGYGFEIKQHRELPPIEGFSCSVKLSVPFNFYLKD